jgi:hypothetical protein
MRTLSVLHDKPNREGGPAGWRWLVLVSAYWQSWSLFWRL